MLLLFIGKFRKRKKSIQQKSNTPVSNPKPFLKDEPKGSKISNNK
jgi:hypothetical protein